MRTKLLDYNRFSTILVLFSVMVTTLCFHLISKWPITRIRWPLHEKKIRHSLYWKTANAIWKAKCTMHNTSFENLSKIVNKVSENLMAELFEIRLNQSRISIQRGPWWHKQPEKTNIFWNSIIQFYGMLPICKSTYSLINILT